MVGKGKQSEHVVVIGAGIVGVSTAIWLQRAGFHVTLIDREGPAAGTSYGNGGVLASCSVIPVTVPGLIAKAPAMIFDRQSPLFLKWSYLPKLFPWLRKYLSHCNAEDVERIGTALTYLLHDSIDQHQALVKGTGAEKWLIPSDYVFGYASRQGFESDSFGWSLRRKFGYQWDELDGPEFDAYDPAFGGSIGCAIRLKDHGHVTDPGKYVEALADHVVDNGGVLLTEEVVDFEKTNGAISGVITRGTPIDCDHVVLSTGVWSGPLAKSLGVEVPLESERGYHIELIEPSVMPRSPMMIASGKFVATPMEGRLRCAGIVEFGGLDAPPSEAPFALLEKQINQIIPGLTYKSVERWMGHRPAISDSIPLIGSTTKFPNAYLGFGHHHIGLTGGPKTGRILADLISGRKPNADLAQFGARRFEKQFGKTTDNQLSMRMRPIQV